MKQTDSSSIRHDGGVGCRLSSARGILARTGLACLITLTVITACSGDYAEIESYIQESPDRALSALQSVGKPSALFPSRLARYELLTAWALDGIHADDGRAVGEMQHSAEWYARHGSSRYWMLSQYYLGDQQFDSADYSGAMFSFTAARDLANARKDWLYAGLSYQRIGDILRLHSGEEATDAYQAALSCFVRARNEERADSVRSAASLPVREGIVCPPHLLRIAGTHNILPEECEARSEEAIRSGRKRVALWVAGISLILFVVTYLLILVHKKNRQIASARAAAEKAQKQLIYYSGENTPAIRALAGRFERICRANASKPALEQFESVLYEMRHDTLFHKELLSEVFRHRPEDRASYQNALAELKEGERVLLLFLLAGMPRPVIARIFGTSLKSMHKRIERLAKKVDISIP
ncbi:MAG: hypothetical protein J5939_01470 [Bacteroidales bacterium]|nr:hypothetical protein [Bacteroidales bacterium]